MAFTDLDTDHLFSQMFFAAKPAAGGDWDQIRGLMKIELKSMGRQIKEIGKGVAAGDITQKTAQALIQMMRNSAAVMLASMSALMLARAEKIVDSALGGIRDTVNGALGFEVM